MPCYYICCWQYFYLSNISALIHEYLILDASHPNALNLRERGCEDPWFFFSENKVVPREREFGKHCSKFCSENCSQVNMDMSKSAIKFRSYILIQPAFWENRRYEILTRTKIKITVFWAIEQAMKAQRVSTGITLSFLKIGFKCEWVVNATPRPLYPRERPFTNFTGGWVDPRTGLDGYGKSRPHRNSKSGPLIPQRVSCLRDVHLNMQPGGFFEMSAPIYEAIRRHIPQDRVNVNVIL